MIIIFNGKNIYKKINILHNNFFVFQKDNEKEIMDKVYDKYKRKFFSDCRTNRQGVSMEKVYLKNKIYISSNINKADDAQYIFGVFSILIALLG